MSIVYIVSAPSGSGKSTLVNELFKMVRNLDFSISYTTRPPRGSEQNGKEYFFVSRTEFEAMIAADEFLEYARSSEIITARRDGFCAKRKTEVTTCYSTSMCRERVRSSEKIPDAVSIFILPPDRDKLEWRLRSRGLDSEEVIRRRLDTARREIENYEKYDYILVNNLLEQSADELKDIVLAERLLRSGAELSGEEKRLVETAQACRLDQARERVQPILASFNPQVSKRHMKFRGREYEAGRRVRQQLSLHSGSGAAGTATARRRTAGDRYRIAQTLPHRAR